MKEIITILLAVITVGSICGSILLWTGRKETDNHARTILMLINWCAAFMSFVYIFRTWNGNLPVDGNILAPEQVFFPIALLMLLILYPLELIQPVSNRAELYIKLYLPLALVFFIGICGGIVYTPLSSYEELCCHLNEANVWFRIFTMLIFPFYGFFLCRVRYNWKETCTTRNFIRMYAAFLCIIGLLKIAVLFTLSRTLFLANLLVWIIFLSGITYYELREHLYEQKRIK
ncbi:MAG: hypothetical protein II202_01170 [Bacteroidales bacterium]|nr:hypothetical protein [Bacteroidales bacterium]